MESIYTELPLYGSKNECARTDTVFYPMTEVCDGKVSRNYFINSSSHPFLPNLQNTDFFKP